MHHGTVKNRPQHRIQENTIDAIIRVKRVEKTVIVNDLCKYRHYSFGEECIMTYLGLKT